MSSQRYGRSKHPQAMGCFNQPVDNARRRFAGIGSVTNLSVPQNRKKSFLSVVVPAKNEAASLAQLINEITRALRRVDSPWPKRAGRI